MASLAEIQALVEQIKNELPLLINRSQIAPKQIVTIGGLSDISERLGLLQAGEFRSGNGLEPGYGFSGTRLGYPAFAYAGDTYNFVGVNDDVLQVGISADDGKLYFGAGAGILDIAGISLVAGGFFDDDVAYKFVGPNGEQAGGMYASVDGSDNTFIALRAHGQNGGAFQTVTIDAVASDTAEARLTVDSSLQAGSAGELSLVQDGTGTTLSLNFSRFVHNLGLDDVDFSVFGVGDGVDDDPAFWVDASLNRAGFGTDHFFGIGDGEIVYFNERGLNIDVIMKDEAGNQYFVADASAGEILYRDFPLGRTRLYHQVLGATSSNVNLYPTSTIPGTAKDLHIRITVRTDRVATGEGVKIEINDDTGNNYSYYVMWHQYNSLWDDTAGHGVGPSAFFFVNSSTAPTNEFSSMDIWIYDYASTDKNKNIQMRGAQRDVTTNIWFYDGYASWHPATPAAITKIELQPANGGSFIAGSKFTIWLEN